MPTETPKGPYQSKTHILWNTSHDPHFHISEIRLIGQTDLPGSGPLPARIEVQFDYGSCAFGYDPECDEPAIRQLSFEAQLLEIIFSYGGISREALTMLYKDLARLKVNGYENAPTIAATLGVTHG